MGDTPQTFWCSTHGLLFLEEWCWGWSFMAGIPWIWRTIIGQEDTMIVRQIQGIPAIKDHPQHHSSRNSNPWVLHQKVCGVSPIQCIYWNFLEMGQSPPWLFLRPYLHLRAWDQGGGGRCGLLNVTKTWNTTRMNIDRTILVCFKEKCFLPSLSRICTANAKAVMVKK